MNKKLYRSREDHMIFGVCGGLATYTGIDVSILRVLVALAVFSGVGLLAYIIAGIVIPLEPKY